MPAKTPEEMAREWQDALNRGDVDALVALYEPGATLIPQPGQTVSGSDGIRQALAGFVAMKPRIALRSEKIVKEKDVALVYGAWTMNATGPDGKPVEMTGQSTEVLRRQPDGSWRYLIDDPFSARAA